MNHDGNVFSHFEQSGSMNSKRKPDSRAAAYNSKLKDVGVMFHDSKHTSHLQRCSDCVLETLNYSSGLNGMVLLKN